MQKISEQVDQIKQERACNQDFEEKISLIKTAV